MKLSIMMGGSSCFAVVIVPLLLVSQILYSHAWSSPNTPHTPLTVSSSSRTTATTTTSTTTTTSRRGFFHQGGATLATLIATGGTISPLSVPAAANAAAGGPPTPSELERLRKGLSRVQYLLLHWDDETQVCGKVVMSNEERKQVIRTEGGGSGGCEKTPLKVQDFMGYKSTEDPLYRVDKLMVRAAQLVNPDDFENYLEVVEKYKDKADNTAMMAYTSSWGEANPNGGKEVIDDYLERTKEDVIESEKYLMQIVKYLNLEPLPPMKKP